MQSISTVSSLSPAVYSSSSTVHDTVTTSSEESTTHYGPTPTAESGDSAVSDVGTATSQLSVLSSTSPPYTRLASLPYSYSSSSVISSHSSRTNHSILSSSSTSSHFTANGPNSTHSTKAHSVTSPTVPISVSTGTTSSAGFHLSGNSTKAIHSTAISHKHSKSSAASHSTGYQASSSSRALTSSPADVHNMTGTPFTMSSESETATRKASATSPGNSTTKAPASGPQASSTEHSSTLTEGGHDETPQNQTTASNSGTSHAVSVQTIVSTVTPSGGPASPVTLVTTVEAAPSTGTSGATTPTQPSGTQQPSTTATPASHLPFPTPYIWDISIGNQTYHLPASNDSNTTVILADGKLAQLSHDKVKIGDTEVSTFELSASNTIEGHEVHKEEGKATEPDEQDSNNGGGGGLFGFLGGLAGGAKKAAGGIKDASSQALSVSSDLSGAAAGAVDGVAVGTIAGRLSAGGKDINDFVAGLNGIQKSVPKDRISKAGLDVALDAQNLGRQAANWLVSTAALVEGFPKLDEGVREQVGESIKSNAGEGGLLGKAAEAMEAYKEFEWDKEVPERPSGSGKGSGSVTQKASATSVSTGTVSRSSEARTTSTSCGGGGLGRREDACESTVQSSTHSTSVSTSVSTSANSTTQAPSSTQKSSSSTSSSASATPTSEPYVISSKRGTPLQTFKDLVQKLDKGAGKLWTWDIIDTQMYLTNLTSAQAKELKEKNDFILDISPNGNEEEEEEGTEEFRALNVRDIHKLPASEDATTVDDEGTYKVPENLIARTLVSDPGAPWWKKMVSAPKRTHNLDPSHDPHYWADDSGGKDTTIYVLDNGFDRTLSELAATGRTVDEVFAPNELTLPGIAPARHFAEDEPGDHGTM